MSTDYSKIQSILGDRGTSLLEHKCQTIPAERLLIETASRDGLTGIHNRRFFDEHIDKIWAQAIRERVPVAGQP